MVGVTARLTGTLPRRESSVHGLFWEGAPGRISGRMGFIQYLAHNPRSATAASAVMGPKLGLGRQSENIFGAMAKLHQRLPLIELYHVSAKVEQALYCRRGRIHGAGEAVDAAEV